MTQTVNIHVAKTHLSNLLERVERGEEFVIARAGKPIARLGPLAPVERTLGFVDAVIDPDFFEPLPPDELTAWDDAAAVEPTP
jgi:prevent-host-death family protein